MKRTSLILALSIHLLVCAATADGATKLTPNQRNAVSRGESYIKEVDKSLPELAGLLDAAGKFELPKVNYGALLSLIKDFENLKQKATNAANATKELPEGSPERTALQEKVDERFKMLDAHLESCNALKAKLDEIRDPKNFPDFDKDYETLKSISEAYRANFTFISRPDELAALWGQTDDNLKWYREKFETYKVAMLQKTQQGTAFYALTGQFAKNIKAFREKAQNAVDEAKPFIETNIKEAEEMAAKAAAEKKPAFFGGGVKQKLDIAQQYLRVFGILAGEEHPAYLAYKKSYDETSSRIDKLRDSLKEEIIAATPFPQDNYKGADKSALAAQVLAQWKKVYPKDEVMTVRFSVSDWRSETGWQYEKAWSRWTYFDTSTLQVRVVVKDNDRVASIYVAFLNRDNANKKITVGAHTKSTYSVEQMLLTNVSMSSAD
ncbi:MAG: hypothetical protein WD768_23405 [Phycisphaeraceae bacterium]